MCLHMLQSLGLLHTLQSSYWWHLSACPLLLLLFISLSVKIQRENYIIIQSIIQMFIYIYHSYSILYIYNRATIYSLKYFLLRPETDAPTPWMIRLGWVYDERIKFDTKWVTTIFQPSLASTLVSYIYTYTNYKCVISTDGFWDIQVEISMKQQSRFNYPLVNIQKTMENHHAINGKINYFNGNFQVR